MSDVTGPIRTLPGSTHKPEGNCDDHPDRIATHRVQGETDSFGSEMIDMCNECYLDHLNVMNDMDTSGYCDFCKQHVDHLMKHRDIDEGSYGSVYNVCRTCIDQSQQRMEAEFADVWQDEFVDIG